MKQYGRETMRNELEIRGYSERTVAIYLKQVQNFAEYFNKAPAILTPRHIHEYQVYLVQQKQVSYTYFNQKGCMCEQQTKCATSTVCALRFFLTMS